MRVISVILSHVYVIIALACNLSVTPCFSQVFEDVVYLKDGDIRRGIILEENLNGYLKLRTKFHDIFRIKHEDILKIVRLPVAANSTIEPPPYEPPRLQENTFENHELPTTEQRRNTDDFFIDPLHHINLRGPRIGFTLVSSQLGNELGVDGSALVTQFGWQYEKRMGKFRKGMTGLYEFVPLVGGLERGMFLPSLSFLVGLRNNDIEEIGFGPNISFAGVAYVFAVGKSFSTESLYIPINFSLVASKFGIRTSLLIGWNARFR